jgi:neutral amino acid transport system ATP-binding protein
LNADTTVGDPLPGVAHEPGVAKPDAILRCDSVSKTFGGLKAVDVAHLEVQRGIITALIGPNGAGKTTFFNLISGFDSPDTGTWSFNDQNLGGIRSHVIARRGMVRTFQLTKALARLTVIENMRLGATGQDGESLWRSLVPPLWRAQEREITERADALLERFNLIHMRNDFAGELSGGQRKLLEMARALMSRPEMVLLDEPTAGVNPALIEELIGPVFDDRPAGQTVVLVEHNMELVSSHCDEVYVLDTGRVIAHGSVEAVRRDRRVVEAYLGYEAAHT